MNKYTLAKQKTLAELCAHKDEQLKALQDALMAFGIEKRLYIDSSNRARCCNCHSLVGSDCSDQCSYQKLCEVLIEQGVE